ncbi:UNVERIFIED_CONTAM: hypothetical protein RMT77_017329 [Armadillidium vulgare]
MKIKVDLSNFIVSSKQFAVFYIDPEQLRTVEDVIHYICTTFELNDVQEMKGFSLYEDIWYIPSNQSSYIFKEMNGIIRLFDDEEIIKRKYDDNQNVRTVDIDANDNNNKTNDDSLKSHFPPNGGTTSFEEEISLQNVNLFSDEVDLIPMETEIKLTSTVENVPESKTEIDISHIASSYNNIKESNIDKISSKLCVTDENQIVDNANISVCSLDSSVNIFQKKKRKRKHCKKGKNKKRVIYSDEKSNSMHVYNDDKSRIPYKFKNVEKYPVNRVHKIFNSEGEEEEVNEQTSNACKRKSFKNIDKDRFSDTHIKGKTQVDFSESVQQHANDDCQTIEHVNTETEVNSTEQQSFKNQQRLEEETIKVLPPTVIPDAYETPLDVKIKFKNLLIYESRIKPKVFVRERGVSYKQNGDISAFYSLPRSFASKRYLGNYEREEEEIYSINNIRLNNIKSYHTQENNNVSYQSSSSSTPKREKSPNKRFDKISPCSNNYERKITSERSVSDQELISRQINDKAQLSFNGDNFTGGEIHEENGKALNAIGFTLKSYQNKVSSSKKENDRSDLDETLTTFVTDTSKRTQVYGDDENRLLHQSESYSDQELTTIHLSDVEKAQSSASLDNFVGCKPRKKNRRYFSSIGNTLRTLKYSNYNIRKDKNRNENDEVFNPRNAEEFNNKSEVIKLEKFSLSKPDLGNCSYTDTPTTASFKGTNKEATSHLPFSKTNFKSCSPENNDFVNKDNTTTNDVNGSMNLDSNEEDCTKKIETNLHQMKKPTAEKESSKNHKINYESYPELETLPKVGDIIATKILTVDPNMCPYYSNYRPARIITAEGLNLTLQFLDEPEESLQENGKEIIIKDSSEITIDWRDLKSTRLIFP